MRCSLKCIRFISLFFLGLVLVGTTACSADDEKTDDEQVVNPTPKLAVVVFATEDPTKEEPTPIPTATQVIPATATPTPAATVGMGVSSSATDSMQQPQVVSAADFESYVDNRPPNVNPLTGLTVDDPALLKRRPLMVRVGNDPVARPQLALNKADMVYEEITEWWITRFSAIYLSQDPEVIAPIRSARLINLQLAPQYQAALASSGGSDGVRWELSQSDIVDLDQLFVPAPYFHRENEGWQTRAAFDATVARQYLDEEQLESNVNLRGFLFSEQVDEKTLPGGVVNDAKEVTIPFPQRTSEAVWKYDADSGNYLRFTTGDPHLAPNGNQLSAANVVIYFADHQATDIVEDSNGATSIRIVINGKGAAWLLRDGKILKGNWQTNGENTPLFVFDNNQPMPLKPGNTWVEIIPLEYSIEIDGIDQSSQPNGVPEINNTPTPQAPTVQASATPTLTPIGSRQN